jgi:hypothetical protein
VLVLAVLLSACATAVHDTGQEKEPAPAGDGVTHHAGENTLQLDAHYGVPILRKSLFWDGNGETDVFGARLHAFRYVADDMALGLGLNAGQWIVSGPDVWSGEVEGVLRCFPIESTRVFFDFHGGYMLATDQVPPGGTVWNFTFGFGPGVDVPLSDSTSLMFGIDYHHTSNALGHENDRNPSQNEGRIWIGMSWTL